MRTNVINNFSSSLIILEIHKFQPKLTILGTKLTIDLSFKQNCYSTWIGRIASVIKDCYLLMVLAAEEFSGARRLCIFFDCSWCANVMLLEALLLAAGTKMVGEGEGAAGVRSCFEPLEIVLLVLLLVVVVIAVVVVVMLLSAWPDCPSTCFLERWRPRFMCRSQYFWSTTASLEQRHFFPSVLLHLPGSGSVLFEYPRWNPPHPTASHNITSSQHDTNQTLFSCSTHFHM